MCITIAGYGQVWIDCNLTRTLVEYFPINRRRNLRLSRTRNQPESQ